MKAISIKEPFASLIASGVKKIETRSWKTNYRGELFIHASKIPVQTLRDNILKGVTKDMNLNCGNIICKCNLVDCVYMDEKFIENIKQNPIEYSVGVYKIGRYAWILEDIELIVPIPINGKLNVWNFDLKYELINNYKLILQLVI